MGEGAEKIPKWESELWSCISSGDGMQCPLYSCCQVRQRAGWCPSDCVERIDQLLDTSCSNLSDYGPAVISCRIFKLVEMLAQKYLKKGKVYYPPVPAELASLADEQYSIEVRLVPLLACHGAIWHLKDRWIIQLNRNDAAAARRFTLFHEAFHILAHRRATPVFSKRGGREHPFSEMLADTFAAFILMPRQWVKEKWAEVEDLDRMAKIFDVPRPVMCIRLKRLGLI